MQTNNKKMNKEDLILFEEEIADLFKVKFVHQFIFIKEMRKILLKFSKKLKKMIGYFVVGDHIINAF